MILKLVSYNLNLRDVCVRVSACMCVCVCVCVCVCLCVCVWFRPFWSRAFGIDPIQGDSIQSSSRMEGGGQKSPSSFSKICHTYPTMMKIDTKHM